jgi:hypothetical protein
MVWKLKKCGIIDLVVVTEILITDKLIWKTREFGRVAWKAPLALSFYDYYMQAQCQ